MCAGVCVRVCVYVCVCVCVSASLFSLSLWASFKLCVFLCLHVSPFVRAPACPFRLCVRPSSLPPSLRPSISPSLHLSVSLSACTSLCLCASVCVRLPVCLFESLRLYADPRLAKVLPLSAMPCRSPYAHILTHVRTGTHARTRLPLSDLMCVDRFPLLHMRRRFQWRGAVIFPRMVLIVCC